MGRHLLSISCWKTAPTVTSEASVTIFVGASGLGCVKSVALANAYLAAAKTAVVSSDQCKLLEPPQEGDSRALRGCKRSAHAGMKR